MKKVIYWFVVGLCLHACSDSGTADVMDANDANIADAQRSGDAMAAVDMSTQAPDTNLTPRDCAEGLAPDCLDERTRRACENRRFTIMECPEETLCREGSCVPLTCTPNQQFCIDESSVGVCEPDGSMVRVRPCNGRERCDELTNECICDVPIQVLFLLDASGSMQINSVGGQTRWRHAQDAIADVMADFPNITYGLKTFPLNPITCEVPGCDGGAGCSVLDNRGLNLPLGSSPTDIEGYLGSRQLSTQGSPLENILTPLHNAFRDLVTADLGTFKTEIDTPRHIILISDGEDTCLAPHAPGIAPGAIGRSVSLLGSEWGIQTYAVGFGIGEGSAQLASISQMGGTGRALPLLATDGDELRREISAIAQAIDSKRCIVDVAAEQRADCEAAGLVDADNDGWCTDLDCRDDNDQIWPGATERPNGEDDDCDGDVDEPDNFIPPPPLTGRGCQGIDFLFVIDNSGSMGDEQDNLAQSVPGFLQAIREAAPTGDYHILVTDSDASGLTGRSASVGCRTINGNTQCMCFPGPQCCEEICNRYGPTAQCNHNPACNQPPPPMLEECDEILGAGRTYSGMYDECLMGPQRFMSSSNSGLDTTFGCLSRVGAGGDGNERMMEAMVKAVTSPLADPGGCNAGFLRQDSILVVTFITDEPHNESQANIDSWRSALIAAKGGNAEAIQVLGIFSDKDLPNPICDNERQAPRFRQFLNSWGEQGYFCSVCADNYGDCLAEAVTGIATTCENFVTE